MTHATTHVTGGCLCGSIRYQAEVFLHNGYICHCTICQRSTGQPAEITVLIKAGTLHYLQGAPRYYDSSPEGKRGFCGECGSRLVWQARRAQDDWLTNLTVGSLDITQDARVTRHICADTQLPWYHLCEELPKFVAADAERLIALLREGIGEGAQARCSCQVPPGRASVTGPRQGSAHEPHLPYRDRSAGPCPPHAGNRAGAAGRDL